MQRYRLFIAATFALLLLTGSASWAEDPSYAPWQGQPQSGDMQQLLKQLRTLIAKAERDKAADPMFLKDLRKLADQYDNRWPVRVLFDDFHDGEFANNPAWNVRAGTWRVDNRGNVQGLQCRVQLSQNSSASQGGSNTQAAVMGILGAILQQQQGGQTQQQSQDQYAEISTAVAISNAFAIRLEIASRESGGRFDFGPYRTTGNSGYFLTYTSGAANGLILSRVGGGAGPMRLAGSSGQLRLEDGVSHVIDWTRDRDGKMTVALDGKAVMEATDFSIRGPFDGFTMANSGGFYTIRSVAINGSR